MKCDHFEALPIEIHVHTSNLNTDCEPLEEYYQGYYEGPGPKKGLGRKLEIGTSTSHGHAKQLPESLNNNNNSSSSNNNNKGELHLNHSANLIYLEFWNVAKL